MERQRGIGPVNVSVMATWEFTSEHSSSYDVDGLIGKLNDRSAEGWEIVTIIPTGGDVTAFFKRELPSDADEDKSDKSDADKKEAAPVAGGLGSLAAGVGSTHEHKPASSDDDKDADKPLSTVGAATHDGPEKLVGDASAASATTSTPDPVKEPSGWAVTPEVPAASTPSTPSVSTSSAAAPAATTPTVATPSVSTPAAGGAPSPWSNSSSTATTPSSSSGPSVSEPMAPIGGAASTPASSAPGASAPGTSAPAASTPSPAPAPSAPTPAPAPVVTTPAGWYPDPSGRFEMRYWDGQQWTEYVSRAGQQFTDPPVA
jgi:hypothetical protein